MIEKETAECIVAVERPGARICFRFVEVRSVRLEEPRAQHLGKPCTADAALVSEAGFVEGGQPFDQGTPVEHVRERQLASAEHISQHTPATARLVEMEDVRELVGHEQLDRIVGKEQIVLDRRMRERDDPVRRHGRGAAVEDVSLVDDDQPDTAARRRSIRA